MVYTESQRYWIWLASVPGLGARRFDALLERFGPPQRIFEECPPRMAECVGAQVYGAIQKARGAGMEPLFAAMEKCGCIAITREDAGYPPLLRAIPDPPQTLYVRGNPNLAAESTIGIVGARNCTAYGTRVARKIARELSRAGATVVSGLARGVDGVAHRGAIDAEARTIAVFGCGVDIIYPSEHRMLADEILERGGSFVSELRPGSPPIAQHFPARNRIISGLSEALLLVEAAKRSGTMTTVAYALEQGREVFALPGQADSPLSVSTHALIRDGARLVTSAADILEDLGWAEHVPGRADALPRLTPEEGRVYAQLLGGPADIDALVETLGILPSAMNSLLTIMELQGIIRKLPGRRVERIGNMED